MAKKGGNIVIIGGGANGMTAAIRAKQRGAEQVILLEASSELGGNAVYAPVPLLNPEQLTEDAIEKEYLEMMQFTELDLARSPHCKNAAGEFRKNSCLAGGKRR